MKIVRRIVRGLVNPACMLAQVLACAPRGSLGRDAVAGGSSTGVAEPSTGAATTESSDGGGGTADGSGSSGGGTSTGHESTADIGEGSSTAAIDACTPDVDDSGCTACIKATCCDERLACAADEVCSCIDTCIADGGDPLACEQTHCGGPNPAWDHLHQCSADGCGADC